MKSFLIYLKEEKLVNMLDTIFDEEKLFRYFINNTRFVHLVHDIPIDYFPQKIKKNYKKISQIDEDDYDSPLFNIAARPIKNYLKENPKDTIIIKKLFNRLYNDTLSEIKSTLKFKGNERYLILTRIMILPFDFLRTPNIKELGDSWSQGRDTKINRPEDVLKDVDKSFIKEINFHEKNPNLKTDKNERIGIQRLGIAKLIGYIDMSRFNANDYYKLFFTHFNFNGNSLESDYIHWPSEKEFSIPKINKIKIIDIKYFPIKNNEDIKIYNEYLDKYSKWGGSGNIKETLTKEEEELLEKEWNIYKNDWTKNSSYMKEMRRKSFDYFPEEGETPIFDDWGWGK